MTKTKKEETIEVKDNEIALLKDQVEGLKENWKRALADYQNLERRTRENHQGSVQFALSTIIAKFLPVLDSLEDANNHLNDDGLAICIRQFQKALEEIGVGKIETDGKTFDPSLMECIAVEESDGEENKVIKTLQKGYLLNGQVVRPAKVTVTKKVNS